MKRWFEVTKIKKGGKTGARLGVIKAQNKKQAIYQLIKYKNMPSRVRVFPIRLIKKR